MPELSVSAKSPSIGRIIRVGLAVLIPLTPIVVALIAFHGATRVVPVSQTTAAGSSSQQANGGSAAPAKPVSRIPTGPGALIAYVNHRTGVYTTPGGHKFASLAAETAFRSPTWVLVHSVRHHWLGVINTVAGNNRIGWIHESAAAVLKRIQWRIQVHLSSHRLVVYHAGTAVKDYLIADGAPQAPTPTGHYAITDRLTTGDRTGPYGCCILATSATAPHHISDWDGGNRIAIHSTPTDTYASIGHSVSHGCVHVTLAEGRWLLAHIPLGTPVNISSA
jgi:lipoprotein-anchoring transpeptidase ErfK/SrfK